MTKDAIWRTAERELSEGQRESAVRRMDGVLESNRKILVAMRPGETPVPIPNTKVKTRAADGTMLETAWESRRLPDPRAYSSAG